MSYIDFECETKEKFMRVVCDKNCDACIEYRKSYSFKEMQEHDKQIRADARKDIAEEIKELLTYSIFYDEKVANVKRWVTEQLKERKNEGICNHKR